MEMDIAAVAAACTSTVLASSTTTDQLAQTTATALTILDKVKKKMTLEAQAAESNKRVARWVMAGQREKYKKLAEERGSRPTSCRRCTPEPPPTLWPSRPPSTLLPCSRARW
jgi:hypothetical protein